MPRFMVERYLPDARPEDVRTLLERISSLWDGSVDGVSYVRAVVIPEDEALVCEFEAPSVASVRTVHARLGLTYDRIVAVDLEGPATPAHQSIGDPS